MRRSMLLAVLALIAAADGCGPTAESPAEPLRIAAASDLQTVLPAVIARFREQTGIAVAPPTFGASGQLAEQIRQGAPFDLFMSADEGFVRKLADEGFIRPESVAIYARGSVVLVVTPEAEAAVRSLDDLDNPAVRRVAIANPELAPYGRAAKMALESAGLWDALQPKVVRAETVRQALQFAQSGNVDAALVGQSIARGSGLAIRAIDPILAPPLPQAFGVVMVSTPPREAEAFADFLLKDGGDLLIAHGFGPGDGPRPDGSRQSRESR